MALEWTHWIDAEDGDTWQAGAWQILIDGKKKRFFIYGVSEDFASFLEAEAYCEAEAKRLPPVPMPQAGEVWSPADTKELRRVFFKTDPGIHYQRLNGGTYRVIEAEWQSWVRESGAVRIDGPREPSEIEAELRDGWRKARIENEELKVELRAVKHNRCDACGAKIIDNCARCGAPQCCPQCCRIDWTEKVLEAANRERDALRAELETTKAALVSARGEVGNLRRSVGIDELNEARAERDALQEATEIAAKGLEEISNKRCPGSFFDEVNRLRLVANKTLAAMKAAAEEVQS